MGLQEDMIQSRQMGMEQAAAIWETLENLPEPIDPVNIYKAVSSVKVAEFSARVRNHRLASALIVCVSEFLNNTLSIVDAELGEASEGMRAIRVIDKAMPLTDEIFNNPQAYATRQHVYDGLLLLASVKLGKETETKQCIDDMQSGIAKVLIMSYLRDSIGSVDFTPGPPPEKSKA